MLRTLFAKLRKVEFKKFGAELLPNAFRDQAHGEMLEVLRLNMIELPDEVVDEDSMKRISRPFAGGIINQHMPFHWSAYRSQPVNVVLWFLPDSLDLDAVSFLSILCKEPCNFV